MKMWISLASMGFMFIAIILIYLSRIKLKQGYLKCNSCYCLFVVIASDYILLVVLLRIDYFI